MKHLRTYARPPRAKRRSVWQARACGRREKRFYGLGRTRPGRDDRRFGRREPAAGDKSAFAGRGGTSPVKTTVVLAGAGLRRVKKALLPARRGPAGVKRPS